MRAMLRRLADRMSGGARGPAAVAGIATDADGDLFDPNFLAALNGFALRIANAQKGGRLAEQRTSARGQGSDFADFKPYVAGDDLRAMDWNLYRRLGKLFVRVFEERQDLPVYILIDRSRSMFVERPPRIRAARRVTLALAAVALRQQDSVTLMPFADGAAARVRAVSGRAGIAQVAAALAGIEPGGTTGLAMALHHVAGLRSRRGLLVIVSDFFDEGGIEAVVSAMGFIPHRLLLVQLTRAHDSDPSSLTDLTGDVTLDDGETDGGVAVAISPALLDGYRRAYLAFDHQLTEFARGGRVGLVRIDAERDVIEQLSALFATGRMMS